MTAQNIILSGHTVISFSTSAYILGNGGIEIAQTINEAEVEFNSPRKVFSSKSSAFSLSGKSSFSNGSLIGLLAVAIATVRCFLQSCCFKLSWPEKKMVANGNKHQLNINIFPLLRMARIHNYTQNHKQLKLMAFLKQQKNKRYIY